MRNCSAAHRPWRRGESVAIARIQYGLLPAVNAALVLEHQPGADRSFQGADLRQQRA